MTRGQRRVHRLALLALGAALALAAAHALVSRRAAWAETEAIRDAPQAGGER